MLLHFFKLYEQLAVGSKRFKNKICAYCSTSKAVTGDHIFAREFFLPNVRHNLPQAPTCSLCNNEKSKLEHYLTALLPFGSHHHDAEENLSELVPKRLKKNRRLQRELSEGKRRVQLIGGGTGEENFALPIREGAIEALFEYIIKGLAWHHWQVYVDSNYPINVMILTTEGAKFFQGHFFSLNAEQRVFESLGNGSVVYEGIQGTDCPQITVWRFHFYGGLMLANNERNLAREIGATSGPRRK